MSFQFYQRNSLVIIMLASSIDIKQYLKKNECWNLQKFKEYLNIVTTWK